MSLVNPLHSLTSLAAARACKPSLLMISISLRCIFWFYPELVSVREPLINVSEAAKPGAKISEKAQLMGDKCAF